MIGVVDSGIGGLFTLKEIADALPYEDLVYLGDNKNFPYGTKDKSKLLGYMMNNLSFFEPFKIDALVLACNTIDSWTSSWLGREVGIPMIAPVSVASRQALEVTKTKSIGLLATESTLSSRAYDRQFHRSGQAVSLYSVSNTSLISEIENCGVEIRKYTEKTLAYFIEKPIDTLILGCTHYSAISQFIPRKINVVDSAKSLIWETQRVLHHIQRPKSKRRIECHFSGETMKPKMIIENLNFKEEVYVSHCD